MQRGSIALGPRLEAWKDRHDQTDEQLARHLGIKLDDLPRLTAESVPDDGNPVGFKAPGERCDSGVSSEPDLYQLDRLADRYGADRQRLREVVA